MNEEEIEKLLKSLPAAPPTMALGARVDRELELDLAWMRGRDMVHNCAPRRVKARWLPPVVWSTLGAAAAVVVMSVAEAGATGGGGPPIAGPVIGGGPPAPALEGAVIPANLTGPVTVAMMPSVLPVRTIREVVRTEDQGIQYNAVSLLPEQHVRVTSVERHAWIDPRDGAQITVEMPHEESVVLPVAFQ